MIELPLMFTDKTLGVRNLETVRDTYWTDSDNGIDFARLYENWDYYMAGTCRQTK